MRRAVHALTTAVVGALVATAGQADRLKVDKDPAQQAQYDVQAGDRYLEKAEAESDTAKAAKLFRKASTRFRNAARALPRDPRVHNRLGYALRKTGNYEEALDAYDRALALAPNYFQAIEYRGVAYLELGRIEDAKQAYMVLFRTDRPLADKLMVEMSSWLERGGVGLSRDELSAFSSWIDERRDAAARTASLSRALGGGDAASGW